MPSQRPCSKASTLPGSISSSSCALVQKRTRLASLAAKTSIRVGRWWIKKILWPPVFALYTLRYTGERPDECILCGSRLQQQQHSEHCFLPFNKIRGEARVKSHANLQEVVTHTHNDLLVFTGGQVRQPGRIHYALLHHPVSTTHKAQLVSASQ